MTSRNSCSVHLCWARNCTKNLSHGKRNDGKNNNCQLNTFHPSHKSKCEVKSHDHGATENSGCSQRAVSSGSAAVSRDVTQCTPHSGPDALVTLRRLRDRLNLEQDWRALILDRHTLVNHLGNSVINCRRPTQHAAGFCHDL